MGCLMGCLNDVKNITVDTPKNVFKIEFKR